jgi:hypothetical protein
MNRVYILVHYKDDITILGAYLSQYEALSKLRNFFGKKRMESLDDSFAHEYQIEVYEGDNFVRLGQLTPDGMAVHWRHE